MEAWRRGGVEVWRFRDGGEFGWVREVLAACLLVWIGGLVDWRFGTGIGLPGSCRVGNHPRPNHQSPRGNSQCNSVPALPLTWTSKPPTEELRVSGSGLGWGALSHFGWFGGTGWRIQVGGLASCCKRSGHMTRNPKVPNRKEGARLFS